MALSRKEAGKVPHDAQELNTKTVNKIGLEADEVLTKDIELNNKGGDQAAQDAADSYYYAFMLVAIILGAAVIVGIGVSFYLVQDVSSRHQFDHPADAGAGSGRPLRRSPAPRREDRDRRHGRRAPGLQGGADRQEGCRRGRRGRCRSQDRARPPRRQRHPRIRDDDRRDRPDRVVGLDPARSLRLDADLDRRPLAADWRPRLPRPRKKPPPTCSRWLRRPKRWPPPSARSAARCRNWRGWRATPSARPAPPPSASASCRRRPRASATWSS